MKPVRDFAHLEHSHSNLGCCMPQSLLSQICWPLHLRQFQRFSFTRQLRSSQSLANSGMQFSGDALAFLPGCVTPFPSVETPTEQYHHGNAYKSGGRDPDSRIEDTA